MSPLVMIFVATAVVAIGIGAVLSHLAKLSGQSKLKVSILPQAQGQLPAAGTPSRPLDENIFSEISSLTDSVQQTQEVSKRVLNYFTSELQKKVSEANQELTKKYESVLQEKAKEQELVWNRYHKALTEKKETEAVIHSIAEGLVVVGPDGNVIMMNPAAERLLGVSKKEKIGKPILKDLRDEQIVSLVKTSPNSQDREIELLGQDENTKKILRASSAIIENENGQTVGMVSMLSDITKQKELDRMKTSFVTSVSHELRTPLVAIDKSLSLILAKVTGPITEAQEQFLAIAQRNLKRLSRLIDDLLDISKLEAGKMELRLQSAAIGSIIGEVTESLGTWANTKSIAMVKNISADLPEIMMDPGRITQVLNNLVGNALKFTPNNGTITITAVFQPAREGVEVSVSDTGIGMGKEHLGKIFDKFYQVGERISIDVSGTGIGLSIARELVELHGGKIWAESEKDHGSKFTFVLPLYTRTRMTGG